MYAILDIETTGGKYNEEGITEIAIYRFDGRKVVDQFISLINPERPIQPFVVGLTGINNNMLRSAPKFYELAKRIIEITDGCILVAHNAEFDNRILTTEFDRLGYPFAKKTLCTVELAKKLIPDQPSYSLGKLVKSLGIPITDRHRANGDALATVQLFKLLLAKDKSKEIIGETIKTSEKKELAPKLMDLVATAPSSIGVYYMHNQAGEVIYIGRNKNIKKRITQHFTSDNKKSIKLRKETVSISFEETGNDLIAQLKERDEIKINKPKYNRGYKPILFNYQLTKSIDSNGYINLLIEKSDKRKKAITTYANLQQAKTALIRITEEYTLCQKLNGLYPTEDNCFLFKINECHGACINKEPIEDYNKRAIDFIEKISLESKSIYVIDRGRDLDERSVILIEKGDFMGYGFYNLNHQLDNPEILRTIITPMQHNRDAQHIIQSYLRKNKVIKILPFNSKIKG